ncbi:pentatricopeptide repeat-containing protein [Quercus suber]|uniref:Pentatricopeptide repeat-containing protein n=1 Tax=Quercus suber TaxID=58331 RepID=A0AAW0KSG4_QUESU
MLCNHGERLAIAFGLLNTGPGTRLLIIKNLRLANENITTSFFLDNFILNAGIGVGGSVFCLSPDVNIKANSFIARLHDGWRIEKVKVMPLVEVLVMVAETQLLALVPAQIQMM